MIRRRLLPFIAAVPLAAIVANACADDTSPATHTFLGRLHCNGAYVNSTTVYLDVPDQPWQPLAQRLVLVPPGRDRPVVLPGDGGPLAQPFLRDQPVLDAVATGWACLTAVDRKAYVLVAYTCTESTKRPGCAGVHREWERLFDVHGTPLNAGFPHGGQHTSDLMKRLGLGRYVDSVQLEDIGR